VVIPSSASFRAVRDPTPHWFALFGDRPPDAPQRVGRPVAEQGEPVVPGQSEDPARLAERRGHLRAHRVVADPDGAGEPGALADGPLHRAGERLRVLAVGPEERLVPPQHLDDDVELPQHRHDLRRRLAVGGVVGRQEHRVRAPAGGLAQRHPGPHAERARLVGRGRDHGPIGDLAAPPDHDGAPGQFRTAQDLDRGQELVEVDVQHPL